MPVYNSENTIEVAIDSVLAQDRADWRLVVADNASTDQTAALVAARAAADPRITLVRQPTNRGQAFNFSTVFDAADTEYFMWLSGDDSLRSDYLDLCITALDRSPELIGVFTEAEGIDGDGNSLGRFREQSGVDRDSPSRPARLKAAVHATVGFAFFGVYRTEALGRSPLLAPYVGSDRVLAGALALIGPIRQLPEVAFFSRIHAQQFSRAVNSNRHRFLSYSGRDAPRFRVLWTTRITTLARLVWNSGGSLAERVAMLRIVFGSYLWRILKGEAMMLVRTGAKAYGNLAGRRVDVKGWIVRRGEVFESTR